MVTEPSVARAFLAAVAEVIPEHADVPEGVANPTGGPEDRELPLDL